MTNDRDDDIQSYINEILDILSEESDKPVSRDELEREFRRFLDYGVPVEQTKQTLIKKFTASTQTAAERMLIADLQPNLSNVHLLCRVISVNEKQVTTRGEKRDILYGVIGDESGTTRFTAWKKFDIQKGDVIEIKNAYTRGWRDMVQINLSERTSVEKTSEDRLMDQNIEPKEYKISNLRSGLIGIDLTVKVLEIKKREVDVNNVKKNVYSGLIGDETGKAQFTSWHDFNLLPGDVIRIRGGYVKTWKGIPQLIFDEKATVEKLTDTTITENAAETKQVPLHELVERRGALDIEVEGTVIEIREGSGLIVRCPTCSRVIKNDECPTHGRVKGVPDLRVKILLDDGTGSVTCSLSREFIEELFGDKVKEWESNTQSDNNSFIIDELHKNLFARRLSITGNALSDEFGTAIIAKKVKMKPFILVDEVESLTKELEELA
jgi:replication factor A1